MVVMTSLRKVWLVAGFDSGGSWGGGERRSRVDKWRESDDFIFVCLCHLAQPFSVYLSFMNGFKNYGNECVLQEVKEEGEEEEQQQCLVGRRDADVTTPAVKLWD